jgi:hypothetical protein
MLDGYKYNRYYPGAELDKEKAHRHKKNHVDYHLERLMPGTYDKYQRLVADLEPGRVGA